jgi:ribosomal protein L17
MNNKEKFLKKIIKEEYSKLIEDLKQEYQNFFDKMLKIYKVDSPDDLDDEKKKEFFNNIEMYWDEGKGAKEGWEDKINEDIYFSNPKMDEKRLKSYLMQTAKDYDMSYKKVKDIYDKDPKNMYKNLEKFIKQRANESCGEEHKKLSESHIKNPKEAQEFITKVITHCKKNDKKAFKELMQTIKDHEQNNPKTDWMKLYGEVEALLKKYGKYEMFVDEGCKDDNKIMNLINKK